MKKQKIFFMLLMSTILLVPSVTVFAISNPSLTRAYNRDWEKLAEARIGQGVNHEQIGLSEENGPLSAVKIRAVQGGINLHRCTFHYKNGETLTVEMRNNIPSGADSRVIQLPKKNAALLRVELWYDTKNYGGRKALLEIWGR